MNLLAPNLIWQKTAQNDLWSTLGFAGRTVWRTTKPMGDVSSKISPCTNDFRYPSPSKQFGSFWAGLLFFMRKPAAIEQRSAENGMIDSGDSFWIHTLLYLPAIKTIGGRKQCRSNIWPLLPFSSRRLPAVWTMTLSAQPLALLPVPLLSESWAAVCSQVRSSGLALVRSATMLACATKLTNKQRSRAYPQTTRDKVTTTVGLALRWFSYVWDAAAGAAQKIAKIYELARPQMGCAGSGKTGAVMAHTILGKAS